MIVAYRTVKKRSRICEYEKMNLSIYRRVVTKQYV